MHKDNNTLLYTTIHFIQRTCTLRRGQGPLPVQTTWRMWVSLICNDVFRWFGGRDQTTEDHHHRKAARDSQKCLQKLAEAGTPCQGAAVLRDGAGHEGSAGKRMRCRVFGFSALWPSFMMLRAAVFMIISVRCGSRTGERRKSGWRKTQADIAGPSFIKASNVAEVELRWRRKARQTTRDSVTASWASEVQMCRKVSLDGEIPKSYFDSFRANGWAKSSFLTSCQTCPSSIFHHDGAFLEKCGEL